MSLVAVVLDDLAAEESDLDRVLAGLGPGDWDRPTPADGWAVRDVVAHLAHGEELATLALRDEEAFTRHLTTLLADLETAAQAASQRSQALDPVALLAWWRTARTSTLEALHHCDPERRVAWVSGRMSPVSFATARLMETWAHGQDVVDALAIERPGTERLRHVADLGVRTRRFAYVNRGREPPGTAIRVELRAPEGAWWYWGAEDSPQRVRGDAVDFCLVATQRRSLGDTALEVEGPDAGEWMRIAQAFAGPPTTTSRRHVRS